MPETKTENLSWSMSTKLGNVAKFHFPDEGVNDLSDSFITVIDGITSQPDLKKSYAETDEILRKLADLGLGSHSVPQICDFLMGAWELRKPEFIFNLGLRLAIKFLVQTRVVGANTLTDFEIQEFVSHSLDSGILSVPQDQRLLALNAAMEIYLDHNPREVREDDGLGAD